MLRRTASGLVLLLIVAGCAAAAAPSLTGPPPWVTGTVTAGPVCPVERVPPDPQCAPRPVAGAVIVATIKDGGEISRTKTAADGTYRLDITTGPVVITAEPVDGLMGTPQPVMVSLNTPGQTQQVDFSYDTGIR